MTSFKIASEISGNLQALQVTLVLCTPSLSLNYFAFPELLRWQFDKIITHDNIFCLFHQYDDTFIYIFGNTFVTCYHLCDEYQSKQCLYITLHLKTLNEMKFRPSNIYTYIYIHRHRHIHIYIHIFIHIYIYICMICDCRFKMNTTKHNILHKILPRCKCT